MRNYAKKLTLMAALTAIALVVFIIEAQIPMPIPIPGVKLGLANAVTLFALFYRRTDGEPSSTAQLELTVSDAFWVLTGRIILGAMFTGRAVAFIYSAAGGLLAFLAQALMSKFVTNRQIWACGAVGAAFHNIGQIIAAMLVTGTPAIAAYLPAMILAGSITGVITGLTAQFVISRLNPRAQNGN